MIKDGYIFDYQLEPMVRNMGAVLLEQVLLEGKMLLWMSAICFGSTDSNFVRV